MAVRSTVSLRDVLFGDGVDHDNVVKRFDEFASLNTHVVSAVFLRVLLDHRLLLHETSVAALWWHLTGDDCPVQLRHFGAKEWLSLVLVDDLRYVVEQLGKGVDEGHEIIL